MAGLKPAYLVCGQDDAKIDAWRARVRRRAEDEGGPGALEAFDAADTGPDDVAAALATLSFAAGDRYLLVDGIERWKAGDLEPLERALADLPPATVVVLIARGKPPGRLPRAVEAAGGECREYAAPKPWQLPKWVAERAHEAGLRLDPEAAKALVAAVGQRQQRLAREVEKLAIMAHPSAQLTAEEVERLVSGEAAVRAQDLADALLAGDARTAVALAEELRSRDERAARLLYPVVRRLREVHRAVELLDAGVPEGEVARALGLPPWASKRVLGAARGADREGLERALGQFADLEVEMRGGGDLDDDTALSLVLARSAP